MKLCALILWLMYTLWTDNGRVKHCEACWCRHPHSAEQVLTGDPWQQDGIFGWIPAREVGSLHLCLDGLLEKEDNVGASEPPNCCK